MKASIMGVTRRAGVAINGHRLLNGVRPETVDFGSWQGHSRLAPAGVAGLSRGPTGGENTSSGQPLMLPNSPDNCNLGNCFLMKTVCDMEHAKRAGVDQRE